MDHDNTSHRHGYRSDDAVGHAHRLVASAFEMIYEKVDLSE